MSASPTTDAITPGTSVHVLEMRCGANYSQVLGVFTTKKDARAYWKEWKKARKNDNWFTGMVEYIHTFPLGGGNPGYPVKNP